MSDQKKNQQYVMSIAEKIKVSVSLLGVAALTVVAYWAQSPAAPISGDNFKANLLAAEETTDSNLVAQLLAKPGESTPGEVIERVGADDTDTSKSLRDLLGIEGETNESTDTEDKETAENTDKEDKSTANTSSDKSETNDSSAGPQEAEESLRRLLGESAAKDDAATSGPSAASVSASTADETKKTTTDSVDSPASRYEDSNITVGPDGVPAIDFTGTTLGRTTVTPPTSDATHGAATTGKSELPATGGPIAIPAIIGLAGAAFIHRKKRK